MQRLIMTVLCLMLCGCVALITPKVDTTLASLEAGDYALDKTHASLIFKVKHLGLSNYVGRFNQFDASLSFDPANVAAAKLSAVIDIDSLDINNPSLKKDLMDGTWFCLLYTSDAADDW